jgi:hypothetical protein
VVEYQPSSDIELTTTHNDRLAVSSGLHQIPTGSLSRLRQTRLTAKHEEEPWIRRTTTFSLPPPNSEIELAERIHALLVAMLSR